MHFRNTDVIEGKINFFGWIKYNKMKLCFSPSYQFPLRGPLVWRGFNPPPPHHCGGRIPRFRPFSNPRLPFHRGNFIYLQNRDWCVLVFRPPVRRNRLEFGLKSQHPSAPRVRKNHLHKGNFQKKHNGTLFHKKEVFATQINAKISVFFLFWLHIGD